jgi:hypothetical protein
VSVDAVEKRVLAGELATGYTDPGADVAVDGLGLIAPAPNHCPGRLVV